MRREFSALLNCRPATERATGLGLQDIAGQRQATQRSSPSPRTNHTTQRARKAKEARRRGRDAERLTLARRVSCRTFSWRWRQACRPLGTPARARFMNSPSTN